MTYWYISFSTASDFLGGTVVEADSADRAVAVASERGLNPGGDAAVLEVPARAQNAPDIVALIDRLAGYDELIGMGGRPRGDVPRYRNAKIVCLDCNDQKSKFVCEPCN